MSAIVHVLKTIRQRDKIYHYFRHILSQIDIDRNREVSYNKTVW